MLFRSTAEDAKSSSINAAPEHDGRAEDAVAWKSSSNHQENGNKPAVVPAPTSKFASLKRKLFPSQNRRHPRHVPPLLISPINAPVKASPSVPPLEDSYRRSMTRICDEDDSDENQIAECSSKSICTESFKLKRPACESLECTLRAIPHALWRVTITGERLVEERSSTTMTIEISRAQWKRSTLRVRLQTRLWTR